MQRYVRSLIALAGLMLAALCLSAPVQAAGLRVTPVRLDVAPRQPNAELTLTNLTNANTAIEVNVVEWRQVNGRDELLPTKDIVFAPPITVIGASQQKKLRFTIRTAPDPKLERTYRVIVKEIEPPQQDDAAPAGMKMLLQISLPVFYSPATRLAPAFVPSLARSGQGPVELTLQNTGNAHIRVQSVELYENSFDPKSTFESGKIEATPIEAVSTSLNATPYILVGSAQTFQMPSAKLVPGKEYWLLARTDCYRSRDVPVTRQGYLWQKLIVASNGTLSSELLAVQ